MIIRPSELPPLWLPLILIRLVTYHRVKASSIRRMNHNLIHAGANPCQIVLQYASQTVNGETVMSYADFIQKYLGILNSEDYNETTLDVLGKAVDSMCTG